MSKIMTWCSGLALACLVAGCAPSSAAAAQGWAAGPWGRAIEVPGLGTLNKGADAILASGVNSLSCASAGNCAAGGSYQDQSRNYQGFVVVERNGRWGRPIEVPVLGPVISVSCTSAGNCAAVGYGSVVNLRNGRWGKAIEVPGLLALNKSGDAQIDSLSCASAGTCNFGRFRLASSHIAIFY
jgi:hypothetical protein